MNVRRSIITESYVEDICRPTILRLTNVDDFITSRGLPLPVSGCFGDEAPWLVVADMKVPTFDGHLN